MEKTKNPVLPEVIAGVLVSGLIFQVLCLILASDRLNASIGLWIGVGFAVFMISHMSWGIGRSLDTDTNEDMKKYLQKMYIIRVGALLILGLLIVYFKIGSIVTFFIGTFSLKTGLYLQPLMHKAAGLFQRK